MDNASQTSAVPPWQPAAAEPDLSGRTLRDYRVLRKLGQGGMGQVYLAQQVSLKRKVALKFLRPDLAANPVSLQRFRNEAEAVAKATHANIVQVYAIDEQDGLHFMALEYVDGRTLKDYLARKGPPELAVALSVVRQTAAALQRASELGIIHRDIKPENILLTRKGEVKVADFGLSRCLTPDGQPLNLTQSGVTMGTPLYMSPEQVEGRTLDTRSDIYSFGVTCYHVLAGEPPFRGQNAFEVALQHVQTEPKPLEEVRTDLPPLLCKIVRKMMAKKPDDRYQTCRELIQDVARVRAELSGVPVGQSVVAQVTVDAVAAPAATTLTLLPVRRRRWLPWLVAGSLLLSGAAGAAIAWTRLKKQAEIEPTSTTAADAGNVEALFSKQKHEQFLKEAVEQYADPGNDKTRIRNGLSHAIELGLLYLDQWRLLEADALFVRLCQSSVEQYAALGNLGHAIVLGLQNKAGESNAAFLALLKDPKRPRQMFNQFESPALVQWAARAVYYNYENAPEEFPDKLKPLRTPGGQARRAGPEKGFGKK
jgi:serine/threonine-protein kinase